MGEFLILLLAGLVIAWALKRYKAAKRIEHPQVSFYVGPDDDDEISSWETEQHSAGYCQRPVSATVKIKYVDSKGEASERVVDVRDCETNAPDGYLVGFCHLRRSIRTFRIDRIRSAVDMDTGEVIADLRKFAQTKYENSPVAAVDSLYENHADALRVLLFVGKADGRFTAKEKDIFLKYCRSVDADYRINIEAINDMLKYVDPPTMHNYKVLCGRLAKLDDESKTAIVAAAQEMIATEKKVSTEEEAAIDYMKKRFAAGK